MSEKTTISYVDATFNPWMGCTPIHAGCDNCYAQAFFRRIGCLRLRQKTSAANWRKPMTWHRKAMASGQPFRVLCGSLCDVFEEWEHPILASLNDIRRELFNLIDETPRITYVIPTKRPENIRRMWPTDDHIPGMKGIKSYMRNVCLLYSASDQGTLEAGLPHLLECREFAGQIGLSLEPLIGPITLCPDTANTLDWVIVGGESGPRARPCEVEWIGDIVRQCRDADVPCWVKQDSAPKAGTQGRIPDDLWAVKQYPREAKP